MAGQAHGRIRNMLAFQPWFHCSRPKGQWPDSSCVSSIASKCGVPRAVISRRLGTSAAIGGFQVCVLVRQYYPLCHGAAMVWNVTARWVARTLQILFSQLAILWTGQDRTEQRCGWAAGALTCFAGDPLCSCSSFRTQSRPAPGAHAGLAPAPEHAACTTAVTRSSSHCRILESSRGPSAGKAEMRPPVKVPSVVPWRTTVVGVGAPLGMAMRPIIVATVIQGPPEFRCHDWPFFWSRFRGVIGSAPTSRLPWKVHLCLWECCPRSPSLLSSPRRAFRRADACGVLSSYSHHFGLSVTLSYSIQAWLSRAFCVVLHVFNAHGILRNPTFINALISMRMSWGWSASCAPMPRFHFMTKRADRSRCASTVVDLITRGF